MKIAIDGLAGSGKGTLSKLLAKKYNLQYLDSGKLYRLLSCVFVHVANKHDISFESVKDNNYTSEEMIKIFQLYSDNIFNLFNEIMKNHFSFNISDIANHFGVSSVKKLTTDFIGNIASHISQENEIRNFLDRFQHDFIQRHSSGVIVDGRDIGTKIMPDASHKFFIICDAKIRAKRRVQEFQSLDYEEIYANILARDERDYNRNTSPMMRVSSNSSVSESSPKLASQNSYHYKIIDTSNMSIDEMIEYVSEFLD